MHSYRDQGLPISTARTAYFVSGLSSGDSLSRGTYLMFESEEVLRDLLHKTPTLLLTGFPELDPRFCPDSPHLVSLGREIPLLSGPVDNLFIDPNGVLTLVECKGYWNSEIKRKVYSQAINYASDL